jgi:hypothetical protein
MTDSSSIIKPADPHSISISDISDAEHYTDYWVLTTSKYMSQNGPVTSDIILTDDEMKSLYDGLTQFYSKDSK